MNLEININNIAPHWDLVVIGGGITGAGILRDATNMGLQALPVEQERPPRSAAAPVPLRAQRRHLRMQQPPGRGRSSRSSTKPPGPGNSGGDGLVAPANR